MHDDYKGYERKESWYPRDTRYMKARMNCGNTWETSIEITDVKFGI
jgi:hypothetical protein